MTGLSKYRAKRRFGITAEPRGKVAKDGNAFVIQKHAARRLHYDLRLQLDGVMKSWAVTRGPSLVPGEKRLAVQVEDHPIDYNKFEGTIPRGEYGGGTVMMWDRGRWRPDGDPHVGLRKGHIAFHLSGKKLHGGWHLVRLRRRPGESRDNWLLIKQHDEEARGARDKDILVEMPLSVKTGRTMDEIAQHKRKGKSKSKPKSNTKAKVKKTTRRRKRKVKRARRR
jgi:bifunctional non-homologous end joining protein LigD